MRFRLACAGVFALGACGSPGPPSPTTIVVEHPRAGGAFEFNYFRSRGSDTQNVGASDQPIKLGGTNFSGPQQVTHDFTLDRYELDARGRVFSSSSERALGAEFIFGAAIPRLAFRVSSPAAQAPETFGAYGAVVGLGALWRLRQGTSLQGRYSYYRGLGGNDDLANATRGEIYLAQAVTKNVVLRAGYVDWSMHVARGSASNSDLNVKRRGPSAALRKARSLAL